MKRYIKSSIEIPDDIANVIDWIFEDYYRYDYDIPDFDKMEYEYDVDNKTDYNRIVNFFKDLDKKIEDKEIELYDGNLQLSDRHVFWEFDSTDTPIDDEFLYDIEDSYIKDFNDNYGVEVSLLGRSGRHACIDFTLDNLERYDELQSAWEEYEDKFIDKINSLNAENSQEEY